MMWTVEVHLVVWVVLVWLSVNMILLLYTAGVLWREGLDHWWFYPVEYRNRVHEVGVQAAVYVIGGPSLFVTTVMDTGYREYYQGLEGESGGVEQEC